MDGVHGAGSARAGIPHWGQAIRQTESEFAARYGAHLIKRRSALADFNAAQALANELEDSNPAQMRTKLAAIDAKIKRLVDAIAEGGAAALGRKIGELEAEKEGARCRSTGARGRDSGT